MDDEMQLCEGVKGRSAHFAHEADIGVRGCGPTRESAFEQAACALTAVIADPETVTPRESVDKTCAAPNDTLLLPEWLNAIVYEMATRRMLFSVFRVRLNGTTLRATMWGEAVDVDRHQPAAEVKDATYGELRVARTEDGGWLAQCVVDVWPGGSPMDLTRLTQLSEYEWRVQPVGDMRVAAVLFGDAELIRDVDDKVFEQVTNVATLPGIVRASYAMPDAHWGYGFPIGGVAAFDPSAGGIVSAGGVGFDISCGVRTLLTGLSLDQARPRMPALADALFERVPAGVGSTGEITLSPDEMDAMLSGGARWAVAQGHGEAADLERAEERGQMDDARPAYVSSRARKRQRREMGTLGSGNHYLEIQEVGEIYDPTIASAFGLRRGEIVVSIHCGSRGLGHQIGTEFLRDMVVGAERLGIRLPDRELACAPIDSDLGQRYLGAMRAGINCALANRQIITHLARAVFAEFFPNAHLTVLYDVSHNTCKVEDHDIDGSPRRVFIHRKGATRALGPGHADLPQDLRPVGQPVLIGGSMGTGSHVLAGTVESERRAFSSACHGAGRRMSRHKARRRWRGRRLVDDLAARGIFVRSPSLRGVAEEAPGAYKDVDAVVDAADRAGLARKVARLAPIAVVKG